jgi:hypothetical protein
MTIQTKKRPVRTNRGNSLRPRAETPRRHFLYIDVMKEEQKRIQEYCSEHKISVSQFLAELMMEDALQPRPKHKQKVIVRAEFELTVEEQEKLELLLRLRQKESLGQFLHELIQPNLEMQRVRTSLEMISIRCYLSEEEHDTITKHVARKGIAVNNYGGLLAIKAIDKARTRQE